MQKAKERHLRDREIYSWNLTLGGLVVESTAAPEM